MFVIVLPASSSPHLFYRAALSVKNNRLFLFLSGASATYKMPQFKLKNRATGKFLTADGVDNPVKHMADDSSDNQKWYGTYF